MGNQLSHPVFEDNDENMIILPLLLPPVAAFNSLKLYSSLSAAALEGITIRDDFREAGG